MLLSELSSAGPDQAMQEAMQARQKAHPGSLPELVRPLTITLGEQKDLFYYLIVEGRMEELTKTYHKRRRLNKSFQSCSDLLLSSV